MYVCMCVGVIVHVCMWGGEQIVLLIAKKLSIILRIGVGLLGNDIGMVEVNGGFIGRLIWSIDLR